MKEPRGQIEMLQAGRGIAACAVLIFHTDDAVSHLAGTMPTWLHSVLSKGYLGVDFFFVLSGFIIHYATRTTLGWRIRFAEGRFTRVYLPYAPLGLLFGIAYTILPSLSFNGLRPWGWIPTLTLIPWSSQTALPVAWTLQHELLFYTGFLMFRRNLMLFCILWITIILYFLIVIGPIEDTGFGMIISPLNLEFIMGISVSALYRRGIIPSIWLCSAGLVVCLFVFIVIGSLARIFVGAACAFGVAIAVTLESKKRVHVSPLLIELGSASYAIYLIHTPVISALVRVLPRSWPVSTMALLFTCLIAGLIYHYLFEKPVVKLTRKIIRLRDHSPKLNN